MVEVWDVIIVGAGPIGCKVGELLGKDHKVLILEKNPEIGKPVQCAGFVSDRIFKLSGVSKKSIVLNKVIKSKFLSPNGNSMILKSKKPFYVVDREILDKEIAGKAKKNNVEIKTKTVFKSYEKEDNFLNIQTNKGNYKTKLLVGADGPNSTVARVSKLPQPDKIVVGVQETVKGKFDSNSCELWFGSNIAPGFFAWLVPENRKWARIGLATPRKSGDYFEKFIEKRVGKKTQTKDKVSGVIKYGLIKDSVADRTLIAGDAACHVKPFSGGGLIYGLIAARIAADACKKSLNEEKYDYSFLKENYEEKWKERLRWPILKGFGIRNTFNNLSGWVLDAGFGVGKYLAPLVEELVDEDLL